MLTQPDSVTNYDRMAISWCDDVDGVDIFLKLPVYLRTYYTVWERNRRIRDAELASVNSTAETALFEMVSTQHSESTSAAEAGTALGTATSIVLMPAFPFAFAPVVVGGVVVNPMAVESMSETRKRKANGDRGGDQRKRTARKCKRGSVLWGNASTSMTPRWCL